MPVQFPDHLVVANRRKVEKRNLEPGIEGSALLMDAVQMPVDLGAIVEILVAQQSEMMAADLVGLLKDFRSLRRKICTQRITALLRPAIIEEELRGARWRCLNPDCGWR